MDYKQKFIEYYQANIHREGADRLLEWLQTTDFFTAPASTSGTPLKDVIKEIMPMIVVMLLELILITFVPNVVLFLPKMFGMM